MRLARRLVVGVLTGLLVFMPAALSHAQGLPVYDNANWLLNVITSTQAVLIVANQILELTPLEELIALEGFVEAVEEAKSALRDLRGLGWDLARVDRQFARLFAIDTLADTSEGMAAWQTEVHTIALESRHDAARAQTLLRTLERTFEHLLGLMESVARMIGNLQISQTISQAQQKVAQLLGEQQLTRTVHERAETIQKTIDIGETETLKKINCNIWKSWPGMGCE